MKKCLSPYKKYILTTLVAPLFIIAILIIVHQFKALTFLSSLFFLITFISIISLIIYSTYITCPKCKQALACNKEGYCFAPFDVSALNAVIWHHCKKCEYDLRRCEEES